MQSECGVRIFSKNRITHCVFEINKARCFPAGITKELNNIRSPKRAPILFYSFRDS